MDGIETSDNNKQQSLNSKIQKLDQDINDAELTIEKLTSQGLKLKEKLDELIQEANKRKPASSKQKNKNKNDKQEELPQMPADQESETCKQLEKELENADKQLLYYKKENIKCKGQGESDGGPVKKIFQLEEQLIFKTQQIEHIQIEMKNLEKIKREQEKQIATLQSETEMVVKINDLRKESVNQQEKIQKLIKKKEDGENTFLKKQEMMEKLQEKCAQIGISSESQSSTPQNNNKKNDKIDIKKKSVKEIRDHKDNYDQIQMNLDSFKEIKAQIDTFEKTLKKIEKNNENEKKKIDEKIQQLFTEKAQYENKIKEKEKEREMAEQRYNEYKKLVRARSVKPIEQKVEQQQQQPSIKNSQLIQKQQPLTEQQKEHEQPQQQYHQKVEQKSQQNTKSENNGKQNNNNDSAHYILNTGKRGTQRFLIGHQPKTDTGSSNVLISDDVDILGDKNVEHFIIKVTFFVQDTKILGLQAEYFSNGEITEGLCSLSESVKEQSKKISLELEIGEQITKIECNFDKDSIDYVYMEASAKQNVQIGKQNPTAQMFAKEFASDEQVLTLFSGLQNNQLTFFGYELKKE